MASRPEARATRPTQMGRAVTISLGGDWKTTKPIDLQVQRLRSRFALSPAAAGVIAYVIYGGGNER